MQPLVGLIMGSVSDWETLQHTAQTLPTTSSARSSRRNV